jgi:hypothetical protein
MVRLPANEVRDMIFGAFEEYDYWSLKALVRLASLLQNMSQVQLGCTERAHATA